MKIDQIWDLILELDESGDVTGVISYAKDRRSITSRPSAPGIGRMTVTLDGRRIMVSVEEPDDG